MFYFGTLAIIGLSTPENQYSPFVATYLNFIDPLRFSLLYGAQGLLSIFGHSTFIRDNYTLAAEGGGGVRMVYSCIGYGVMSFWAAFVIANKGQWKKKAKWILGGLLGLWVINISRIALLLLAAQKDWSLPLGWDHHTWFNIFAYTLIFLMIYFYDSSGKRTATPLSNNTAYKNLQAPL